MQSVDFRLNSIPAHHAEKPYAASVWVINSISATGVSAAGQVSYPSLKIAGYLNEK